MDLHVNSQLPDQVLHYLGENLRKAMDTLDELAEYLIINKTDTQPNVTNQNIAYSTGEKC